MGLEWSIDPPHCGSGEENKQFEVVSAVRSKTKNMDFLLIHILFCLFSLLLSDGVVPL